MATPKYDFGQLCHQNKGRGGCVCYVGTKTSDNASVRIGEMLDISDAMVIIHVGANDGGDRSGLLKEFQNLVRQLKGRRKGVTSGILPRVSVVHEWISRALNMRAFKRHSAILMISNFIDFWQQVSCLKRMESTSVEKVSKFQCLDTGIM